MQTPNVNLVTVSGVSLVEYALTLSCRAEIILALFNAYTIPDQEKSDRISQLIAVHREGQLIAETLRKKEESSLASVVPELKLSENRFSMHPNWQDIPPKDRQHVASYHSDPSKAVGLYKTDRLQLISELTRLYDIVMRQYPEIAVEFPPIEQLKHTAPNRSLQSKITSLRALVEDLNATVYQSTKSLISTASIDLTNDKSTFFFASKKSLASLLPILGLTMVANHHHYVLVTQQLATLIHDYSDGHIEPFRRVLTSPMISHKNGLKDIKVRNITAIVRIDKVEYTLPVPFYLKVKKTKHRILVAQLAPNSGPCNLLLPIHWLNNGFHDNRHAGKTQFRGGSMVTSVVQEELMQSNHHSNS